MLAGGHRIEGREGITAMWAGWVKTYDGKPRTRHITTNPIIALDPDGKGASCQSQWTVIQAAPGFALQLVASGRYADRFARDAEPGQRGHLLGHVACQADKTFDAIDVMVQLFTAMPAKPERLELVRSTLMRSQETDSPSFRELQDKLRQWHHRGYQDDPRRALMPAYDHLKFDDIVAFYKKYVAGKPLVIMVVGDPRKATPERLRKYGKLVRLREGQLYSP